MDECDDRQAITDMATLVRDVPGDRKVDGADLTALLCHVAKIELLEDDSRTNVDGKGGIDAADITYLAKMPPIYNSG